MIGADRGALAWGALSEPLLGVSHWWRWWGLAADCLAASAGDPDAIDARRSRRLAALVEHARRHSPWYAERYAHLPPGVPPLASLPVVGKRELMGEFDRWVTDPSIRREDVERFVADPARIGESWLGRYAIWTSSGSTGEPGIYVQDPEALAVYDALLSTRLAGPGNAGSVWRTLAGGGRLALIAATGGHFAGVVSWERLRRNYPMLRASTRVMSVLQPLERLIDELNAFAPSLVASYPTTMILLAQARRSGHLRIRPASIWCGGETMSAVERDHIAHAFDCRVIDDYGASECMAIAFDCGHGSLHLNADWVILEPVDTAGRPCADGEPSASVLLTNLANHVQPLIRYDLGDSVTVHAEPCASGCRLPRISVDGRRDDIISLTRTSGAIVRLAPLAVETVVEEGAGISRFQVIRVDSRRLSVRFEAPAGVSRDALWARVARSLRAYLAGHGLSDVVVSRDERAPVVDPRSGKFRQVLARMPAEGGTRAREPGAA